jgi:hypothetical protein
MQLFDVMRNLVILTLSGLLLIRQSTRLPNGKRFDLGLPFHCPFTEVPEPLQKLDLNQVVPDQGC